MHTAAPFDSAAFRADWPARRLDRRRFLGVAAASAAALLVGRPQVLRAAPITATLTNGLRVVVEERPSSVTVAMRLLASVGARDDSDLPGLTIFTLSMTLGTEKRPGSVSLRRTLSAVGGTISFNVQSEGSYYAAHLPASEVNVGFDVIADVVKNPDFDPLAVPAIARNMDQARRQLISDPTSALDQLYAGAVFEGHPLAIPSWGTDESVREIDLRTLREHRRRYFGASNLVLAVVGKIRAVDAMDIAERYFTEHFPGAPNVRTPIRPPLPVGPRLVSEVAGGQQALVRLGFATPGFGEADFFPLWLLDTLMSGTPGRLFRAVRGERGLAYSADSTYSAYSDAGTWYVTAGVDPRNVEPVLEVIRREIEMLRTTPVPPNVLADAVEQLAGQLLLSEESNVNRASQLAWTTMTGQPDTSETLMRLRTVTPTDLQRAARTHLDPAHEVVALVSPE